MKEIAARQRNLADVVDEDDEDAEEEEEEDEVSIARLAEEGPRASDEDDSPDIRSTPMDRRSSDHEASMPGESNP